MISTSRLSAYVTEMDRSVLLAETDVLEKPWRARWAARLALAGWVVAAPSRCQARSVRRTQFDAGEHGSVIGEADQASVERRIPEGGEEQTVVHVKALRVVAHGSGHDVGGPQQGGIGDAGDGAAASPIIHQRCAEDVLADALDDEPLGLGRLREACGPRAKSGERGVGEADAELVDAVERSMKRGQGLKVKGGETRPG